MAERGTPDASGPVSGVWHLVPEDTDEQDAPPQHRVDVRLYLAEQPCRAAIVNRNTNEDALPYVVTEFDGKRLRLGQPSQAPDGAGTPRLWFDMEWDGARFNGGLVDDKGNVFPGSPRMKLIRAH